MKRVHIIAGLWTVLVVSVVAVCIQASSIRDGAVFLERGKPSTVACPLVASGRIPVDQIDIVYWYFSSIRDENILISYFFGRVAPQNGIAEGVYDIDGNFSLVVRNVIDSDEETYYCSVKPKLKMLVTAHVMARVKVSPKAPFPNVTQCTERISETACQVMLPNDIEKPMLTCIVRDVKPAVALRWFLEYSDGDTQLISDRFTVQASNSSWNTFITSASIPIIRSNVDVLYKCQAYGEALGARNGSHVTVTVTTAPSASQPAREQGYYTAAQRSSKSPGVAVATHDNSAFKDNPDFTHHEAPIWIGVVACMSLTTNAACLVCVARLYKKLPQLIQRRDNKGVEPEEVQPMKMDPGQTRI